MLQGYFSNTPNSNRKLENGILLPGLFHPRMALGWRETRNNWFHLVGYKSHGTSPCHTKTSAPKACTGVPDPRVSVLLDPEKHLLSVISLTSCSRNPSSSCLLRKLLAVRLRHRAMYRHPNYLLSHPNSFLN